MTFRERYEKEDSWYGKVIVMEIYHLTMTQRDTNWTIAQTAMEFGVSIGLVSENLRLAEAFHERSDIINCDTRTNALKKLSPVRRYASG